MKKQTVMKETDPVSEAEAALREAQEGVTRNRQEVATLTGERDRLWAEIGRDGDEPAAERKMSRHGVCHARLAHLDLELPGLAAQVATAEAALDLVRKQAAQAQIDRILGDKFCENETSTVKWRELLESRNRARALQGEANQLAETYGLPRPNRTRWLLRWQDIRSDAAEEVRATIDEARIRGVGPGAAGRLEGS